MVRIGTERRCHLEVMVPDSIYEARRCFVERKDNPSRRGLSVFVPEGLNDRSDSTELAEVSRQFIAWNRFNRESIPT
jgi:hypothetical protein